MLSLVRRARAFEMSYDADLRRDFQGNARPAGDSADVGAHERE